MSESAVVVLSSQESAIESGKTVVHGTATDRVLRMFEAIRAYGPPRVSLDRAILFTESFKETEGSVPTTSSLALPRYHSVFL